MIGRPSSDGQDSLFDIGVLPFVPENGAIPLYRCLSASPSLPTKTATIPPHPHRNPIDTPASTAPAAHFKRLYRNCPPKSHTLPTARLGAVTIES
jgi:hypothetical protein